MFGSLKLLHKQHAEKVKEEKKPKRVQRRNFFRVTYPETNRLKIENMDAEVVDIGEASLRFCGFNLWDELSSKVGENRLVELSVAFNDDTSETVAGNITKCYSDVRTKQQYYILIFNKRLSFEKISHEQSYVLKHFPEFSRELLEKSYNNN